MINKVVELNQVTPSQNVWERLNRYVKPKMMLGLRDSILYAIGEGPWKKVYLKKKFNEQIKRQVVEDLRREWPVKRRVFVEVHTRRPRRLDGDNNAGGMKPLWDAIQWAGWCVTDHVKWLKRVVQEQEIGDPKTVISIYVPENDADEEALRLKYGERGI